jgi:hypothetical protein
VAQVPSSPGSWYILYYEDNRVDGDADPNYNGGSPILQWQVAYGTSPTVPGSGGGFKDLALSTGSIAITGLAAKTVYYFWNRQRNAVGWSGWSPRTMVRTRGIPDAPDPPSLIWRTQNSISLRVLPNYDGASPITGFYVRYGLSPNGPTDIQYSTTSQVTLTGLSPGGTYYFWGQAINAYGESFYSARSWANLIAGAKVQLGGVTRRAVPYVKVSGVWRVARPWIQTSGFWNETSE